MDKASDRSTRRPGIAPRELLWLLAGFVVGAILYYTFVFGTVEHPDILRDGEPGVLENLQAVILFVCVVMTARLWQREHGAPRLWLTMVGIALFLILGEEISWGQHLFGWGTPAWMARHNAQDETNLHNTSWLLNELPRNIVRAAIVFGGAVYPVVRRFLRRNPFRAAPWLPPGLIGVPAAVFVGIVALVNAIPWLRFRNDDVTYFELSEVEELFFYLFFLTYLIGFPRRAVAILD